MILSTRMPWRFGCVFDANIDKSSARKILSSTRSLVGIIKILNHFFTQIDPILKFKKIRHLDQFSVRVFSQFSGLVFRNSKADNRTFEINEYYRWGNRIANWRVNSSLHKYRKGLTFMIFESWFPVAGPAPGPGRGPRPRPGPGPGPLPGRSGQGAGVGVDMLRGARDSLT